MNEAKKNEKCHVFGCRRVLDSVGGRVGFITGLFPFKYSHSPCILLPCATLPFLLDQRQHSVGVFFTGVKSEKMIRSYFSNSRIGVKEGCS